MQFILETAERRQALRQLLDCCLTLEQKAVGFYKRLSTRVEEKALASFFLDMARQEAGHVTYWQGLIALWEKHRLKNPFDETDQLLNTLLALLDKLAVPPTGKDRMLSPEEALQLSFELEFSLLDPAFGALFFLLAEQSDSRDVTSDYEAHIAGLQAQVVRLGVNNPLFNLISRQMTLLLRLNRQRASDLTEIYSLRNVLPICMHCKKVRDDNDHWDRVESYIMAHTGAAPSHGICPECMVKHYGDLMEDKAD